ncbi:electron transfer flavoprotein subunit alpha/FixB family protein [Devosia sp. BK]|uniref:electron transfer flavoprotein subunit alpha/FixB family protein n=1 Tax=Devosia sp. BK TaxID=2871706 RepID=UPI002939582A|nr:electron transfer flavoprotein subunit alpha/FixB family protein [Devosia sp. BK]MDV3251818.1 electron transfer flavoprotein subunit alpha/FixB family protein [Devosia sp. BK]
MSVLLLADHDNGVLSPATARLVAASSALGVVDILVVAENPASIAAEAAKIAGVQKVITVTATPIAETITNSLEDLTQRYRNVVASASSVGKDVIPRLAAKLDIQPVTDVVEILGPNRFTRPIYAGNALETVEDPQATHLLTFRASAFRPAASGNNAPVESLDISVTSAAKFLAAHRTDSDTPDLATAQIVIGGGVSVGSAEGFQLIEKLGKTLGAAVGATRAAVDAGYAPNDWQIGQTGKIIAPDLYIAIGISGALQHLAGIQGAKKIFAINSDPEAPLVKIADVELIGDLFEIVPQLVTELERLGLKR